MGEKSIKAIARVSTCKENKNRDRNYSTISSHSQGGCVEPYPDVLDYTIKVLKMAETRPPTIWLL